MNKKICYKCEEIKSTNDFYRCNGTPDGLQYKCKSCVKEYYRKNKSKINKYKKEYRKNNKEKIAEGKRKYYSIKDNMDHKKKHDAEYYEKIEIQY
jgi:transposase-like protein